MKWSSINSEVSCRINALRFPLIVLVVLIHANDTHLHVAGSSTNLVLPLPLRWVIDVATNQVARIAVPFFFIVSSYLLGIRLRSLPANWSGEVGKRLWRLIPPYLGWNVFYTFFYWFGWFLPISHAYFSGGTLKFDSTGIFFILDECFGITLSPADVPLWYVRNLVLFLSLSYPLPALLRRTSKPMMFVVIVFLTLLEQSIPNRYRGVFGGYQWFLLGFWFGLHGPPIDLKGTSRRVATALWASFCALGAFLSAIRPEEWQGPPFTILFELVSIPSGMWVVWSWCGELNRIPTVLEQLKRLAPATFVIFAAHGIILVSIRKLVWKALEAHEWPLLMVALYLFCPIFTLAVSLLVYALIRRLPNGLQRWFDNPSTKAMGSVQDGRSPVQSTLKTDTSAS